MSAGGGRWSDLGPRIVSGVALAALSVVAIGLGGFTFTFYIIGIALVLIWEQSRMFSSPAVWVAPILALVVLGVGFVLPKAIPVLIAGSALIFAGMQQKDRVLAGLSNAVALAGTVAFIGLAADFGPPVVFWLIGIVVLTDIGGYFGGRIIGGPKLWPAVSPKKTWSGTITGWVLAAGMTALLPAGFLHGVWLVPGAVLLSAASQAGDLFESHVKRRRGVKDSSNLIPGHGGVWDRFDGMITAAIAAYAASAVW